MAFADKSNPRPARRIHAFSEAPAWERVGEGWRPMQGSFADLGFSVEWHDFTIKENLDWSPSFHPSGVEICLNLTGHGEVHAGTHSLRLAHDTAGFYFQDKAKLKGFRTGQERHRFLTIEFSRSFLTRHLQPKEEGLHPSLLEFLSGKSISEVSEPIRLSHRHQEWVTGLSHPPVAASAQRLWYHGKALEIASTLFYRQETDEEFFCQRLERQNRERVERVIAILRANLAAPPQLEEIGRRVGCSHFHLSRIFSQEMGRGIFQYLRALRMERAAELLREGRMNVTQVALEVGYASPSHFSTAFHETFGCCPGLYPLKTLTTRTAN